MNELFLLSPAKLNLALNIVGQKANGYHLLQSIFQFISLYDYFWFKKRADNKIIINSNIQINQNDNLIFKACKVLNIDGIEITCFKNIPLGSGLGGGSSNAATTLLALNHLFNLKIKKNKIIDIGLELGADVPFFLFGENSFVEGVGEKLTSIKTPNKNFLILYPNIHVKTKDAFCSSGLIRNNPCKNKYELLNERVNVFLPVILKKYKDIREAFNFLQNYSQPYLTGTGSCIFLELANFQKMNIITNNCLHEWRFFSVKGLECSPLQYLC